MKKRKLEEYYLNYLDGKNADSNELHRTKEWLAKNEKERAYLEQLHKATKASSLTEQLESVDVDKSWERFRQSVEGKASANKISFFRINNSGLLRIAASVAVLLTGAILFYILHSRSVHSMQQSAIVNNVTEIVLPDGSHALLNKGSVLSYPRKFRKHSRNVELKGEARFDVVPDTKAPFSIHLENLTVEVLGTSFLVREGPDINTVVNVFSGKVAFYEKDKTENRLILHPGQKGIFDMKKETFELDSLDKVSGYFWNEEKLNFSDQPLEEVFSVLAEVFKKEFRVADPDILHDRITSKCSGQNLEEILTEFSIMLNIQYKIKGDTIFIQKRH